MCIWIYTRFVSKATNRQDTVYHHPEDEKNVRASGLQLGTRHIQCFMTFLCMACSFCIRGHLSVTIVSMTEKSSFNDAPVLAWDSRMKGAILSAFYWGYVILLIPAGQVSEKFGPKFSLVIAMFICGIVMILTPFAVINGGFYLMLVSRMLQGATQAFTFPSVNVVLSKWAPTKEKSMLSAFVFGGMDFGTVIIMATAGALVDSRWGWPSVFYVCGGVLMSWAIVYAYVGANSPQEHKTISESEKLYILSSLSDSSQEKKKLKTPWKAILTSVPMIALTIAHSCGAWGFYTILFQTPSYMRAVLGLDLKQSGSLAALPYLSSLIIGNVYAVTNYWLNNKKILSRTVALKSWNSFSSFGVALMLCLLALAGKTDPFLVVILVVLAVTINSSERVGYLSNHLDLAPNFAGTLMGMTAAVATVGPIVSPLYAGFIVMDQTSVHSWRIVFLTAAIVMSAGNVIFLIFGTAKVQPWNFPPNNAETYLDGATSNDQTLEEKDKTAE